jgi:hypothetical protein
MRVKILHRPRSCLISRAVTVNPVRVSNIQRLLVRRKAKPIRTPEPICNSSHIARSQIEAIDVGAKLRLRSKALLEAIYRIGEPDATVRMYNHIVERTELTPVEVIENCASLEWRVNIHVNQATARFFRALSAEQNPRVVVDASVAHV